MPSTASVVLLAAVFAGIVNNWFGEYTHKRNAGMAMFGYCQSVSNGIMGFSVGMPNLVFILNRQSIHSSLNKLIQSPGSKKLYLDF